MNTINAQTIINEVMQAHAVAPAFNKHDSFIKIKFQTAAKGFHTVTNTRENLQRFADLVRKNATAFGGGIIRTAKPKAAISWPANLISLFKQSIEDKDYAAALDIAEHELGGIFYPDGLKVAPVPCDDLAGTVSGMLETGTYEVYEPLSGLRVGSLSYKKPRSRQAAINAGIERVASFSNPDNFTQAMAKAQATIVNHDLVRAQWMQEHGLDDQRAIDARILEQARIEADQQAQREARRIEREAEREAQKEAENAITLAPAMWEKPASEAIEQEEAVSLGDRFEAEMAKRKAAREALATQDVAQVVSNAVAAIATSEAMQPGEAPILSTLDQFLAAQKEKMPCIRYAQTSRVMHSLVRYDEEVMKAHSWIELLIQSEGRKTTNKQENKLQDMTRLQSHRANNEEQQAHEKRVKLAGTKTVYYAQNEAGSMVELSFTEYLYAQFLEAMQPSEALELVTCEAGENEAQAQSIGSTTGNTPAWSAMAEYVPCSPIKTGFGDAPKPSFSGGFEGENDKNVPTPPVAVTGAVDTPRPAVSDAEKRKQWQGFAHDIPASLAISAYNGVSMSPERRGASAQNEYGQTMAADYETMRAQATKGGTLDLLPEVFARYRSRQSSAYKAYLSSSSRCVSSFIAGPANFPAARMNKRSEIAHKRLGEYLNGGEMALQAACRTLRPDLRAIMAGDVDAIDRLTVDISSAERTQDQMKAANKAIRTNANAGEAHQVAALMELGHSEAQALELLHPRFSRGQGFPSYRLTNNQANIRRMRERLEKITAAKARPVETVECSNGVTLEDDAPANRVRLFFPGKPSDEIRADLKSNGFRWAPSVGAWQAYRNYGTLATAKRIAGEPVTDNEPAPALIEPTPPAVESQQVAMAPSVETDVKQSHDAPIAHQINESGAWTSERCEAALNAQDRPTVQSKSGKWCAWLFINGLGLYGMGFEVIGSGLNKISSYPTASDRMKALQAMARAADAPTDTPPTGGLPCPVESAPTPPVAESAQTPHSAVSSAIDCTRDFAKEGEISCLQRDIKILRESLWGIGCQGARKEAIEVEIKEKEDRLEFLVAPDAPPAVSSGHARNIVPENGLHIVDDAFEAWTFPHKDRFGFVMYLGKSAKPWKYYGYPTEAKRDAGFERCATEARDIAASKAKTKAETKARIDAGHGLQVGDVVRSSWGYEQTNVSHYQIIKVIGKRTVEVRKLAEHDDSTGDMSGRCSPVWGEFAGDVKRCMVDQFGSVNVMGRDFGRASKIEPIAMVHGVRCYAATYYSSYA